MKKLHSLFILSILALTMFVGCQMPTEDVKDVLSTTYRVNVTENTYKANVSVDNVTPKAGDTVVITITVPADFSADDLKLSVMKGTETVTFTDEESTENNKVKKSFTMPESDVTVTVNFEKKATPTDDNGNEDDTPTETPTETPTDTTPTVDADEATYGFVKTVDYTVKANGQSLPGTKTGAELIAIAKEKNLVKDTDYTIDGTAVSLTASGAEKYLGKTTEKYSLSVNASDLYAITGGGMKEAGKTVTLSITHYDVNTGWGTPEGLYLVKVHIKEGETELNIEDVKVENHKITFTMPDKNINVFASFEDIKYERQKSKDISEYKAWVKNATGNTVTVVLCFKGKAYDNLEPVDGKYVFNVGDLENCVDTTNKPTMYFTETKYGDYELIKTGTLDDNHYKFGVIDNNRLIESTSENFTYKGLQSN